MKPPFSDGFSRETFHHRYIRSDFFQARGRMAQLPSRAPPSEPRMRIEAGENIEFFGGNGNDGIPTVYI